MINDNKLIVKGNINNGIEQLTKSCVIGSSFYIQWEKNNTYTLQFTARNDGSVGYTLIEPGSILYFNGQEYLINQPDADKNNGYNTKAVVATHVYFECQWFRQRDTKQGTITYRPDDIMHYVFDGNVYGFTWEVHGNFDGHQIENLGNMSGLDAVNKIIEVWPDAVIIPDNKKINIYQHDEISKHHGNRIAYGYNASEVKLSWDVSAVTNQVWCIGKPKEKEEGTDDNAPVEYYFPPFLVSDTNSMNKWTHGLPREISTISDERFTDPESMKNYALSQLTLEAPLTVEATLTKNFMPIKCDIVNFEDQENNLATDVEVVGYEFYPWFKGTVTNVTLNDTAKTIFDYQNAVQRQKDKVFKNKLLSMDNAIGILKNKATITAEDIKHLTDKVNNLQPKDWNAGSIFIDTSSNNGDLIVEAMQNFKDKGAKGIICKLTEGTDYTNQTFDSHKNNATNAGLKFIGTYHLFHGNPVSEANFFLSKLQEHNVDKNALVIADIEASDLSGNKDVLTNQVKQFYQILIDAGYTNTCDYASSSWFNQRFDQQGKYSWVADYSNHPNQGDAWQFTENWNGLKIDASYSYNPIFV